MSKFKFDLNDNVTIALNGTEARVHARAEYIDRPNSYCLHYINGVGDAKYDWFDETDII